VLGPLLLGDDGLLAAFLDDSDAKQDAIAAVAAVAFADVATERGDWSAWQHNRFVECERTADAGLIRRVHEETGLCNLAAGHVRIRMHGCASDDVESSSSDTTKSLTGAETFR